MNKTVIRVLIVILLVAGAIAVWRFTKKKNASTEEKYKTEVVDRGNVMMTITATGTLSAVTTVQVGSQVSGVISRLYADFNDQVKKGQLLAELDPTPFEAQAAQRNADLTRATVELRNSEINLRRQKQLSASGLSSQADLDTAQANYDAARAQVQQSAAALSQAQTNLRYTKILSPIDGVVADRQYDVGQTVAASFQAPTLFTIAQDLTKMQVQADVDQSDVGRIKVGQVARFSVDAYPDEDFVGRVNQLRLNATVNQTVVSYPVIIEVANNDGRLRPKMTANVTIEVEKVQDVVRVPNAALRFRLAEERGGEAGAKRKTSGGPPQSANTERGAAEMGGRKRGMGGAAQAFDQARGGRKKRAGMQTVHILRDGKPQPVEIRTGITDGRFTQVVDGAIKPGDAVIVGFATSRAPETTNRPPRVGGGRF